MEQAKSRLRIPTDLRYELAVAMATDTLRALSAAVDHVLVIGDETNRWSELGRTGSAVEQILEPEPPGLNAALSHGAALLRERGATFVLACVGDLPALRADSVRRIVEAAQPHPRSFLADAAGVGTTMLIARNTDLYPLFGDGSAEAHARSGAHPLAEPELRSVADARTDVDTENDLAAAIRIGLGPATRAILERSGWPHP